MALIAGWLPVVLMLGALLVAACQIVPPPPTPTSEVTRSAERRGITVLMDIRTVEPHIEPFRSLVVTEKAIVDFKDSQGRGFSLKEVLEVLACPAERGCTPGNEEKEALALFQNWWAIQNGSTVPPDAPCPPLFGFPYCPRDERQQATDNPFHGSPPGYVPVGLFNRIDLADKDGADCGEYRIVFARSPDPMRPRARVLLNFEAVLPNPDPSLRLAGCKPIAEFWYDLAKENDPPKRAARLRKFYFEGLKGTGPVLHVDNFSDANGTIGGQVRTNQFMQAPWMLREFRLVRPCRTCRPLFVPARVAQAPFGPLFSDASTHSLAAAFKRAFLGQLRTLSKGDLNTFTYWLPEMFSSGQSIQCDRLTECLQTVSPVESDYRRQLGATFRERIADTADSQITADQLVARAQALSCAGCHELSSKASISFHEQWPESLGFVHVSEEQTEDRGQGPAYRISRALHDDKRGKPGPFLQHRVTRLQYVLGLSAPARH